MNHLTYMKLAQELALKGKTTVSPNPMVGAVIVKNGKIIAQGFHHHRGGPHAEVIAMQKTKTNLSGATMYVTLEPCFHYGCTPPCVDAVIKSGINNVVIGMKDPNRLTNGKSIAKLRRAGIKVQSGILEQELCQMNEAFVKYITKEMPFVVAKTAQTLDGKIATQSGESKWITSDITRKYSHDLRNEFDAIMVGINTVLKDDPRLNAPKKRLKKVILDSSLQIPLKAKLFRESLPGNCFIATTNAADKKKLSLLEKRGVNVIVCPIKNKQVDLKWLMKELANREIAKILIEGGGKVIGSALKDKLVDKMMIYIAPKIMGEQNALSAIDGLKALRLKQAVGLRGIEVSAIGEDFLIEGYIK